MVTDIFKRDSKTGKPVKLGSVKFNGTDVTFHGLSGNLRAFLQKITTQGKTFTPLDGSKYVNALPYFLSGSYLWASPVRN